VCPGIITIIWSLITSDTVGGEPDENEEAEGDIPDDQLTEMLNNPEL